MKTTAVIQWHVATLTEHIDNSVIQVHITALHSWESHDFIHRVSLTLVPLSQLVKSGNWVNDDNLLPSVFNRRHGLFSFNHLGENHGWMMSLERV